MLSSRKTKLKKQGNLKFHKETIIWYRNMMISVHFQNQLKHIITPLQVFKGHVTKHAQETLLTPYKLNLKCHNRGNSIYAQYLVNLLSPKSICTHSGITQQYLSMPFM